MRRAVGEIEVPFRNNPRLDRLKEKGVLHEQSYLKELEDQGLNIGRLHDFDDERQVAETRDMMREGLDIIYQGSLSHETFAGRSDFLIKVDLESALGDWSYEVVDTKLSQTTRAGTILQLCLYSDLVAGVQGMRPRAARVIKPAESSDLRLFEEELFSLDSYWSYYELVKRQFLESVSDERLLSLYPEPCSHCEICRWFPRCDSQRRDDDHLSFVAGIQASQINEIRHQGSSTLQEFADADDPIPERPSHGSRESIEKAHRQARVQLRGRLAGENVIEFLPVDTLSQRPESGGKQSGFLRLPLPSPGDVYLDFEGNPHAPDGVLEYLFGYTCRGLDEPTYHSQWCLNRSAERVAFSELMRFLIDRRKANPDFHIYHFAPYEPAAMKRMAMRHQVCEAELDEFLRAETFVDLHAVVRQSIVLSVESYSIKKLEAFYGFARDADLPEVRSGLNEVEYAIEFNCTSLLQDDTLRFVEVYNRDDCMSTMQLHDWVEKQRQLFVNKGVEIPRPEPKSGDASESISERNIAFGEVRDRLKVLAGEPRETNVQHARWLMAHLLEYFFREDKTVYWELFRHMDLEDEDLLYENAAIAGLELLEQRPPEARKRNPTSIYRYAPQEHTVRREQSMMHRDGQKIGKVVSVDHAERTVEIRKAGPVSEFHPTSVFAHDLINAEPMPAALLELGREVAEEFWDPATVRSARYDLLARRPPQLTSLTLPRFGDDVDVAIELAADLDHSVLPIQGPPGSGKTHVGGHMIVELASRGFRIGITAVSHKVITNLIGRAAEFDPDRKVAFAQKANAIEHAEADRIQLLKSNPDALTAVTEGTVVGGTAWLWSRDDMGQQLDYLFIDEAGQMSLAQALAAARAAKNVILLGDPQQLEQPQRADHPEGADVAVLGHLIGEAATIPQDRGLFLSKTRRLHPDVCHFTSEQFYDSRLTSHIDCTRNEIMGGSPFTGSGLRLVSVEHVNNQNRSDEEVSAVREIVDLIHGSSATWRGPDGEIRPVSAEDILIVAPYNAQVDAIALAVGDEARVGTVDKFQGQEAPIVIYSTASSSADDAPRGMEFLYDPHRLNVATSRSKCITIMVASPRLFHPRCKTPRQMKLANAFCRFAELAEKIEL